jgi:hypothetical protein
MSVPSCMRSARCHRRSARYEGCWRCRGSEGWERDVAERRRPAVLRDHCTANPGRRMFLGYLFLRLFCSGLPAVAAFKHIVWCPAFPRVTSLPLPSCPPPHSLICVPRYRCVVGVTTVDTTRKSLRREVTVTNDFSLLQQRPDQRPSHSHSNPIVTPSSRQSICSNSC